MVVKAKLSIILLTFVFVNYLLILFVVPV